MFIDTFILACHQSIINKSQKTQRWWAYVALRLGIVFQLVITLLSFDMVSVAVFLISAPLIFFLYSHIIRSCPEQGLGHESFFTFGSCLYFGFVVFDLITFIFATTTPYKFACVLNSSMFMCLFYFLRCGEPKTPEKKHEFKLATELN